MEYFEGRIGQLEDDIGEYVLVTQANQFLQEDFKLVEILSGLIPLILL